MSWNWRSIERPDGFDLITPTRDQIWIQNYSLATLQMVSSANHQTAAGHMTQLEQLHMLHMKLQNAEILTAPWWRSWPWKRFLVLLCRFDLALCFSLLQEAGQKTLWTHARDRICREERGAASTQLLKRNCCELYERWARLTCSWIYECFFSPSDQGRGLIQGSSWLVICPNK